MARRGCFVSNTAAHELLDYGLDAISAIESQVLDLAAQTVIPYGLASVMVTYSRLVRRFEADDRWVMFIRRLLPAFREHALIHACAAWNSQDPTLRVLPDSIRACVEEISRNGTEKERRRAEWVLQRYKNDRTVQP